MRAMAVSSRLESRRDRETVPKKESEFAAEKTEEITRLFILL